MTIAFTINKSRERVEKQWEYLVKRGVKHFSSPKTFFRVLAIATGFYVLFCFVTSADDFVIFKVMSFVVFFLGWVAVTLFSVFIYFRNRNNKRKLKTLVDVICSDQLTYEVYINNESLKLISGQQVTNMPWTQFTYFGVYNDTLYIFNDIKRIDSLFWDRDEMGTDNYSALINLLKQKAIKQAF